VSTPTEKIAPARTSDRLDERLQDRSSLGGAARTFLDRLRSGDLGTLPVVAGLVVIFTVMYFLNDNFLSPRNLVNLTLQMSDTGVIALGIVVVLLVGQIDLSVGSVSGVAAAITAITFVRQEWPVLLAIGLAVATGCFIGWVYSIMFNRFGVPSFVISLAGLLGFLGLQLALLSPYGRAVNIPFDSFLVQLSSGLFLPAWLSYVLVVVVAGGYFLAGTVRARERRAADLSTGSTTGLLVRSLLLAAGLALVVSVLNQARGVGWMFVLFVGLVVAMHYALTRTRWGRSLFAVGGVLAASRLTSASTTTGTGDVNLNAIAAAVIGGTSLFGGRGSAFAALLGIAVIQSISNGLVLLNLESSIRFMVTGAVLLLAVTLDSLARRSRSSHGVA